MGFNYMPGVGVTISGAAEYAAQLSMAVKVIPAAVTAVVYETAEEMRLEVKNNARGRANAYGRGPRIKTSRYINSIEVEPAGPFSAITYTDTPYAARLEFGFVGVDSLGRHYNQPPYPSWRPALDVVVPHFINRLHAVAVRVL